MNNINEIIDSPGIKLIENEITIEEYLSIRKAVNWKQLSDEQASLALNNSLYTVGAYDTCNSKDDCLNDLSVKRKLIGMGRIVGDGAVICYVQDLIVLPEYQKRGVGSRILRSLTSFVNSIKQPDTEMMFCLMCAKGRERFYKKHGFIERPTDNLGPGMIQYLK